MKTKTLQEKLNQALTQTEKITGKDITLPILSNISLKSEKGLLLIIATNLETGISWKIPSKTEEEGSVVLPAQTLSSLIGSFPSGSISIDSEGNLVTITSENRKSTINGLNPEEFPILPINTDGECLTIKADLFCQSLAQVSNFTSNSTVKPEITGVYLVFKGGEVKIVATDSFRLGEKTISISKNKPLLNDYAIIIPSRAVKEIISIFNDQKNVNIYFGQNQIIVSSINEEAEQSQIDFVSRLIEGEFPDYQAIIPVSHITSIVFSKKELLNHLKSASLFSGKNNEVSIEIIKKNSSMVIFSQSSDLGKYESELKLENMSGEDIKITFNYRFLIDGLSSIKDDKCMIEFSSDEGPGLLRAANDANFIYILMPIKKF
jgi:DNA polymerase III subunit beta